MKKTYMIPNQKIAELDMTDALLAGSDTTPALCNEEGDGVQLGKEEKTIYGKTLWDEMW